MTATHDDTVAELQRTIAELRGERHAREKERDAALARESALADVLAVINRSPKDPGPVYDAILEKARVLCGAEIGVLSRWDGEYGAVLARHGYSDAVGATLAPIGQPYRPHLGHAPVLRGERFSHVLDVTELEVRPGDDDAVRAYIQQSGTRTWLLMPMRRDGALIGFISMARGVVRAFSAAEIAILECLTAQAVIAMENARLLGELRERTAELAERNSEYSERIEHQSATIDVLKAMSASPGDPQPVFDLICRRARTLLDGPSAVLFEYDGELVHLRAESGTSSVIADAAAFATYMRGFPMVPVRGSLTCRAILDGEIVHVRDLAAEPGISQAALDLGHRTQVSIPLMRDGRAIGAISAGSMQVDGISDSQIALLKTFAEQAVIAITSAETYRALQTRTSDLQETQEYQTATSDVLKVISQSTFDLQPVLDTLVATAKRLCNADMAIIYRRVGDAYRLAANLGFPREYEAFARTLSLAPSRASVTQRAALERRISHVADIAADPEYELPEAYELGNARTALGVPLLREGEPVGVFTLARQRVEPFSEKEIALVSTFADQAVIAIENTRLLTETREALERQTATAEVLGVINSSPGDLTPVFDAILEKAHSLCDIAQGSLELYDGGRFRAVAVRGLSDKFTEMLRRGTPAADNPATRPLIEGSRFAHIRDVAETDYSVTRSAAALDAVRTLLCVPLRRDGLLLGMIASARREVRPFSEKEIALLENFAAQAVIAMENARLITEQREALEQQTATTEILQVINASPGNLVPVFEGILEKATRLCQSSFGLFATYDGQTFHNVAFRGIQPAGVELLGEPVHPRPGMSLYRIAQGENIVQVADIKDDEAYRLGVPNRRWLVELAGARTQLVVALRKDDTLLGAMNIFRQEVRPFSDKQIELLQNFASQAVIAMENARLLDEIRQRQDELRVTFDNMGDGVAMFDTALRLTAWNRNFQRIIDLPDTLLETRPRYADYLRLLAERGEFGTTDIEAELSLRIEDTDKELRLERVRPDGRVIEVRRNAVPGGGFVLIYSDITERKRSEEEIRAARDAAEIALRELRTAQVNLIQAEKMASLGQLTAGIAHEIKNPLNFVNNFSALSTELIGELRDVLAPEPLGETARTEVDDLTSLLKGNLEKVVLHGQRADGIVRSMLDHSRGSSGERRIVDLNALIDEALNLAYHGARAQDQGFDITLERDFGEGITPIEVNPRDITRVFLNIFSNGFYAATRRASEDGDAAFVPTLKVITIDVREAVEIRVRDNGIGIPPDIRDKLFQPFFTTKPTGEGTGLGLSITYDIVTQQHGGSITVDSKVGDYSEFTIRLPHNP